MATSTIMSNSLFYLKTQTTATSASIANNAGTTLTITATAVSGYTPIAVVEVSTTHSLAWQIGGLTVNPYNGTITLYVTNHSGSSQTISATFRILYVKSEYLRF